jgi:uncharacterized protein YcfJ
MRRIRLTAAAAVAAWSAAAAAVADMYPTILVTPGPNKPIEVFHDDQAQCRDYADQFVRGEVSPGGDMLAGAAVGAALGAILGSAAEGRHGHGAAIGAAGGAVAGTAVGVTTGRREAERAQRAYDDAYARCMYAHDDLVPGEDPAAAGPPPPRP